MLSDYQDRWVEDFEAIKSVITSANRGLEIEAEHIGSTAIPGLSAKPIIDIDLIYAKEEDFNIIKANLESIGYFHNGDQGIASREVFKRNNGASHPVLDVIKHHLYVCHQDSEELKKHLIFRDKLRSDQALTKQYGKLKQRLAAKANQDHKLYAQLKESEGSEFFKSAMNQKEKE
ncbi:GrpB family protein [Ekhidna sp.]